jgi:bifunctional non-homologous end joining protein LigD
VRTTVDGRDLRLTNLQKVLYPSTGTTKADVLRYYDAVAAHLLPFTTGRPATRGRWPDGVGAEGFVEKNLPAGTPSWVKRVALAHRGRTVTYPLVEDRATLLWLAQSGALELHVPQWRLDAGPREDDAGSDARPTRYPDRLVIDLDPGPPATLETCVEVALAVRSDLAEHGLAAQPVTSGGNGLHLYVSLTGDSTSEQASELAHGLAQRWEEAMPALVVSRMRKDLRGGRVLVDWSQNNAAKTTIAPYSLRGRDRPTVAAPRTWTELEAGNVEQLGYDEVMARLPSAEPETS